MEFKSRKKSGSPEVGKVRKTKEKPGPYQAIVKKIFPDFTDFSDFRTILYLYNPDTNNFLIKP